MRTGYDIHVQMTREQYKDFKLISFDEFKELISDKRNNLYSQKNFPGSVFCYSDEISIHANMFLIGDKKAMAKNWIEYIEMEKYRIELVKSLIVLGKVKE